jgi:Lipopolysaccharide-assembly
VIARAVRIAGVLLPRFGLGLGLCLGLGACGYSSGLRVSEEHASIGVEFFGNGTYERDLERPFDDQLTRAIRDMSDAPIVASSQADVIVRGTIRSYYHLGGIRSKENQLLETGVAIEIEATLVDRKSSKVLKGPFKAFSAIGYLTGDPLNEPVARDRALHHIAEELVLDLFADA